MKYEMGVRYFKLNGTTETHEELKNFFISAGFRLVGDRQIGDEMFNRTSRFSDDKGLEFDVIWFVNLSHIVFNKYGENTFFEIDFDEIKGAWLPYADHETLDFFCGGKRTCKLAIERK